MADLAGAERLLAQFTVAFESGDHSRAKSLLDDLKLKLIALPALPPRYEPGPDAGRQLEVAREAAELGLLLAVRRGAEAGPLRGAWALLAPYYGDTRAALPPSPREAALTGLHLLHLLVDRSPAAFHTALELVPDNVLVSPEVAFVRGLEADLASGAYGRVLAARGGPASADQRVFLDRLATTVREEVATCAAASAAGGRLSIDDAREALGLASAAEVAEFAAAHGWSVDTAAGVVSFPGAGAEDDAPLPADSVVSNCLLYAKELERIV